MISMTRRLHLLYSSPDLTEEAIRALLFLESAARRSLRHGVGLVPVPRTGASQHLSRRVAVLTWVMHNTRFLRQSFSPETS